MRIFSFCIFNGLRVFCLPLKKKKNKVQRKTHYISHMITINSISLCKLNILNLVIENYIKRRKKGEKNYHKEKRQITLNPAVLILSEKHTVKVMNKVSSTEYNINGLIYI